MKPSSTTGNWFAQSIVLLAGWLSLCTTVTAQTNNVTSGNGLDYIINGQSDPGFMLQRGVTYVFQLSSMPFHPFWIKSSPGFGSSGAYNDGVVNNGATSGSVRFTVPANAPNALIYQCGNHGSMLGTLTIVSPTVTPPEVRIVHIAVGQNVVVTSTGTNGWSAIPEFKCDLASADSDARRALHQHLCRRHKYHQLRPPGKRVRLAQRVHPHSQPTKLNLLCDAARP